MKERDERKENMLMKNIHEFADSGTQENRGALQQILSSEKFRQGFIKFLFCEKCEFCFCEIKKQVFFAGFVYF